VCVCVCACVCVWCVWCVCVCVVCECVCVCIYVCVCGVCVCVSCVCVCVCNCEVETSKKRRLRPGVGSLGHKKKAVMTSPTQDSLFDVRPNVSRGTNFMFCKQYRVVQNPLETFPLDLSASCANLYSLRK